jgi:hypothetical protein
LGVKLLAAGGSVITVRIGEEERSLDDADQQWINQQINRRKDAGQAVCVRVTIRAADVDVILSTPTCAKGVGGRQPRPKESKLFELWNKRGLDEITFTGGGLIAFLAQAKDLL